MEIETLDDALQYLEDHNKIDGLFSNQLVDEFDPNYNREQEWWYE